MKQIRYAYHFSDSDSFSVTLRSDGVSRIERLLNRKMSQASSHRFLLSDKFSHNCSGYMVERLNYQTMDDWD